MEQRIAHGVLVVESARDGGRIFLKHVLHGDALARRGPHVGDVDVFRAVVVVVEAADAHASADVFNSSLRGDVGEGAVTVVAVEILAAKIVDDVKIGPAIAVEVGPATAKTVAGIVLVKPGLSGHVTKRTVALVAHHEVRRTVVGVVVRRRILILVRSLVIDVEAEVDVEPGRRDRNRQLRAPVKVPCGGVANWNASAFWRNLLLP